MVLGDVLRYLRSKGLRVRAEQIWYAQRAGHIPTPGKDSAGNYDYTMYAAQMAAHFEVRQAKSEARQRKHAARKRRTGRAP